MFITPNLPVRNISFQKLLNKLRPINQCVQIIIEINKCSLDFLSIYFLFILNLFIYLTRELHYMNLNVKTQPLNTSNKDNRRNSNQMDKICSKLEISLRHINGNHTLTKSVKQKIQKYIENDDIQKLQTYLDKHVLNYEIEIGIKSMQWNILHFAAKNNSCNIIKVILTQTYQLSPQKYKQLINTKTVQGYTPLMITIINSSKQSFQLFLLYGGIDIQQCDNKQMTAYELALSYKNQYAIRQLMSYQNNAKRKNAQLNQQLLMSPIDPLIYSAHVNCYSKVLEYFTECFICFNRSPAQDQNFQKQTSNQIQKQGQLEQQQSFLRKSLNGTKLRNLLNYMDDNTLANIDIIKIGNEQIESKYSIQWKRLSTATNQKSVLFDCFQPFDICENNLIIANSLIIFQCLSDHTWLIRKILKPIKKAQNSNSNTDKPNQYTIQIYQNDQIKKITVDQHIPFLKQREQPMFLSNQNEMWTQILQKGLAKIQGSYMKLSEIKPFTFMQNFTGSFTKQFQLIDGTNFLRQTNGQIIKQKHIMPVLQDFSAKGYLVLLQGREGTSLSPKNSPSSFKSYCYTVLNFYQKGNKRLILINCPYVLNSWKEKQKTQIMQLKLIKSHYNTHNQMCVWIEENQFAHFFKSVIVSFTQQNLNRTQLKMRFLSENQTQKVESVKLSLFQNLANSTKSIFSKKSNKSRHSEAQDQSLGKNPRKHDSALSNKCQISRKILKLVFVKFNVLISKNSLNLSIAVKDNLSHQICKVNKFKGWINGGIHDISVESTNHFSKDLIQVKQVKGEYLCMIEVQFDHTAHSRPSMLQKASQNSNIESSCKVGGKNKYNLKNEHNLQKSSNQAKKNEQNYKKLQVNKIKKHQLLVICWSQDSIQLEHIEEQFAVIEWLQSWRKHSIKNWTFLENKSVSKQSSLNYLVQKIGTKMAILTKSNRSILVQFSVDGKLERQKIQNIIYEGHLRFGDNQQNEKYQLVEKRPVGIQMTRDSQHNEYQYIVIGNDSSIIRQFKEGDYQLSFIQP